MLSTLAQCVLFDHHEPRRKQKSVGGALSANQVPRHSNMRKKFAQSNKISKKKMAASDEDRRTKISLIYDTEMYFHYLWGRKKVVARRATIGRGLGSPVPCSGSPGLPGYR